MADPRFFSRAGPFSLARIAEIAGAELQGPVDPDTRIEDVAPLDSAGPGEISFIDNRKYVSQFTQSKATACLMHPDLAEKAPEGMARLVTPAPYKAYALTAQAFYPDAQCDAYTADNASIDETATIGADCWIGPGVYIGANVEIGKGCRIMPNAVIENGVQIGDQTYIGAGSVLSHCMIGNNVHIHPGVCIGQRGFGFAIDPSGHVNVPQLGRVIIEDEVEIGANSTVDRGAGPDTVIGAGARIDNLVQLGHNVRIGKGCVIVAQAGVSGSTKMEDFSVLAAQAGLAGHLVVGTGAQVAAKSGVMRDIPAGERYMGYPAIPAKQFMRQVATLNKMTQKKGKK